MKHMSLVRNMIVNMPASRKNGIVLLYMIRLGSES